MVWHNYIISWSYLDSCPYICDGETLEIVWVKCIPPMSKKCVRPDCMVNMMNDDVNIHVASSHVMLEPVVTSYAAVVMSVNWPDVTLTTPSVLSFVTGLTLITPSLLCVECPISDKFWSICRTCPHKIIRHCKHSHDSKLINVRPVFHTLYWCLSKVMTNSKLIQKLIQYIRAERDTEAQSSSTNELSPEPLPLRDSTWLRLRLADASVVYLSPHAFVLRKHRSSPMHISVS